ncbi:MAG: hypothetical protein ACPGVG_18165 [Mycobacterium sp.]
MAEPDGVVAVLLELSDSDPAGVCAESSAPDGPHVRTTCRHCGATLDQVDGRLIHFQTRAAPCLPADTDIAFNPSARFRHHSITDGRSSSVPWAAEAVTEESS